MWMEEQDKCKEEILIIDGAEYNEKLWCVASSHNRLYEIDIENAYVEKRIVFERLPETKQHLFDKVLALSGCIYLIPRYSTYLIQYHIESGVTEYIDFSYLTSTFNSDGMFITGCCYKQYLFLFPYKGKEILRFDTKKNHVDNLLLADDKKDAFAFIRRCVQKNENIWIAEEGSNRILKMNAEKMQSNWITLDSDMQICDLCIWDEQIFVLDMKGKIIVFDICTEKNELFADFRDEKYCFIEKSKNLIWLIPNKTNKFVSFSRETGKREIDYPVNFYFSRIFLEKNIQTFSGVYSNESEAIIMPRCNNVLIKIDKQRDKLIFHDVVYTEKLKEEIKEYFNQKLKNGFPVKEEEGSLKWFLNCLKTI